MASRFLRRNMQIQDAESNRNWMRRGIWGMKLLLGIILLLGVNIHFTQYFSGSTPLLTF